MTVDINTNKCIKLINYQRWIKVAAVGRVASGSLARVLGRINARTTSSPHEYVVNNIRRARDAVTKGSIEGQGEAITR